MQFYYSTTQYGFEFYIEWQAIHEFRSGGISESRRTGYTHLIP